MYQKSDVPLRPKLFPSEFSIKAFIRKNTLTNYLIISDNHYKSIASECRRKARKDFRKVYSDKILSIKTLKK